MKAQRVILIILGILLVIGGLWCMFQPTITYSATAFVIGFCLILAGCGAASTWSWRKELGLASGWNLAGSILSIIMGVIIIVSEAVQGAVDVFILYLVAAWLVLAGITEIAAALSIRKVRKETGAHLLGANWAFDLVMGILIVIVGVLSFIDPTGLAIAFGILIGLGITMVGTNMIVAATI
jgi:uncharacterized membrane protein HdeD (DUF308 family)